MWRAHATTSRRAVSSRDIMRCLCEVRRGGNLVDVNEDFPWEQPGTSSPHAHADKQAQKDVREVNGNTVGVGHASRLQGN